MDRPWLRAYASAFLGADAPAPGGQDAGREAAVPETALARHACVFGSSGSGKSRLTLRLIAEQMKQGCSVLALDPKAKTIEYLLACSREAGVPPERVVVLDPADADAGPPGWNPLQTDIPAAQAAVALVSILKQKNQYWGPRLGDILINALILLAAHGLTLYELPRFLLRPDYRDGILRLPRPSRERLTGGQAAFAEAWEFFAREFSVWRDGDRIAAVNPVLTRTRALLGSDFFQALLCPRRNTLDLASLWREQCVVLVHLDDGVLGGDGAQLLGGLLAHHLHLTAMRQPGPVPVILALDELGGQEAFIGEALLRIVTVARQQNLRLLVATQHLGSLSAELRDALLTNSQFQAFFQLGQDDAALVARGFISGAPEPLRRVTARVASRNAATGMAARSEWRHDVLDAFGQSLRLGTAAWDELRLGELASAPGEGYALRRVQELAADSGVVRLYVRAADTGEFEALTRYVAGLSETDYWFEGPAPLELVVSFPTPQFVHAQKRSRSDLADHWTNVLKNLPFQHAALSLWHGAPQIARIADVPVPEGSTSDREESRAIRRVNAQSWEEIEETRDWRGEEIERIASAPAHPQAHVKPVQSEAGPIKPKRTDTAQNGSSGERKRSVKSGTTPGTGPAIVPLAPMAEEVADDGSLS